MAKSPDAFRTISEVADWLGIQAHVLRFWESKFSQVKPIKRAGGRRYYRPADMLLLGGIKKLLHDDGLTIKGVQKILREEGMSHVADMSMPLDELTLSQLDDAAPAPPPQAKKPAPEPEEKGVVLNFEAAPSEAPEAPPAEAEVEAEAEAAPPKTAPEPEPEEIEEPEVAVSAAPAPAEPPEPTEEAEPEDAVETPAPPTALPAFLRRPLSEPAPQSAPEAEAAEPEPAEQPAPPAAKPRNIGMPALTPEADIPATPAILSAAYRARSLPADRASKVAPLLAQLAALRDQMASRRRGGTPPAAKD